MDYIHAHEDRSNSYSSFTPYDPVKIAERWAKSGKLRKVPAGPIPSRPSIVPGAASKAGFQATEWRFLRETVPAAMTASLDSFRPRDYAEHAYPAYRDGSMSSRGEGVHPFPPAMAHPGMGSPTRRPFASMDGGVGMLREPASPLRDSGGNQVGMPGSSGTVGPRPSSQQHARRHSGDWMGPRGVGPGRSPQGPASSPQSGPRPSSNRRAAARELHSSSGSRRDTAGARGHHGGSYGGDATTCAQGFGSNARDEPRASRDGGQGPSGGGGYGPDGAAWPPRPDPWPPGPNKGLPFEQVVECSAQVKWEGQDDTDGDYESAEERAIQAEWARGEAAPDDPTGEPASPSGRARKPASRVSELSGGTVGSLREALLSARSQQARGGTGGGGRRHTTGDVAGGKLLVDLEVDSSEEAGGGDSTGPDASSSDSDRSSVCFVTEAEANSARQRRRWQRAARRAAKRNVGDTVTALTGISNKGFFPRRATARANPVAGAGISSSGASMGAESARRGRQQHPVDREMASLLDGLSGTGRGADARDNDMPVLVWRPSARVKLPLGLPPALLAELGDEEEPAPRGFLTSRRAARSACVLGSNEEDADTAAHVAAMYNLTDVAKARSWVGPRHCGTVPGESPRRDAATRYGSWYIPPKLWKEAAEGVDFLAHSKRPQDGAHRGAEQAHETHEYEAQLTKQLSSLYSSRVYKDYMKKNNLRVPHYLQAVDDSKPSPKKADGASLSDLPIINDKKSGSGPLTSDKRTPRESTIG